MSWIVHDVVTLAENSTFKWGANIGAAMFAVFFAGLFLFERHRRENITETRGGALIRLAHELGLEYQLGKNFVLTERYCFIQRLSQGTKPYASNVMTGIYKGHPVTVFDYHYTTTSSRNTGLEESPVHHSTVFILHVGNARFPELLIAGDGPFTSLAQTSGHADVNFESREFSDKYYVGSSSKQFAYAICHSLMMEYLLANPVPTLEFENDTIALTLNRLLKPERFQSILDRLVGIRSLVPDYLLTET